MVSILNTFLETCQNDCCWQGPSQDIIIIDSKGQADGIDEWLELHASVEACAKRCEDLPDCLAFHYYGPHDSSHQDCFLHKGGDIGPQLEDGRIRMAGVCAPKGKVQNLLNF